MASKRSRTGCLTCRQRKLKCSEESPICAQCVKANRECVPSSGITFRHQQNPSMNGGAKSDGGLKNFYGYKETFGKSAQWVEVPKDLRFVNTTNPYEREPHDAVGDDALSGYTEMDESQRDSGLSLPAAAYPEYAMHGLEALSAVASQDQSNYPSAQISHERTASLHSASPQQINATPAQHLDFILNPTSGATPPEAETNIDPQLHSQESTGPLSTSHEPTSHHKATTAEELNSPR